MEGNDILEVEQILENLRWLQSKMPTAIANWQATKPDCTFHVGILRDICNSPMQINNLVFDPLIKWLSDYILNREGRMAFAGPGGLDIFLRKGLRIITTYIIVADFFSNNTDFFSPNPKISKETLEQYGKSIKVQKQYKNFLNEISSRVIGCNDQLSFLFLTLSKTIREVPDDLKKIQTYLENYCLSLRVKKLE